MEWPIEKGGNLDLPRNFLIQTLHKLNKAGVNKAEAEGSLQKHFLKFLCMYDICKYKYPARCGT